MGYFPTQEDINILFQPEKIIYGKIELLNKNFLVVESLEGHLISDSYVVDSTSAIRRTYTLELHVTDSSFQIGSDKKFWFDKYVRPYVGIYSLREKRIIWYLKGTFLFSSANYNYNIETNTVSLTCLDLMCKLTGDRNGNGIQSGDDAAPSFIINQNEDIRNALIGILKIFGFTNYRIDELPRTIQSKLQFDSSITAYSIIDQIMEFCPNYEYFFDLDGTFIVQKLPCYTNDMILLDDDVFREIYVSESYSVQFSAKNCIEIWGKTFESNQLDGFATSCNYNSGTNTYEIQMEKFTLPGTNADGEDVEDAYRMFGFTAPASNKKGFKVKINDLGTYTAYDDYDREIPENYLKADTMYIFMLNKSTLYFLGESQIHAFCKNENSSDLSIENMGEEIWEVCSGGEYENINSEFLAKERAIYECYYKSNLNDTLVLETIDIPWLDVNQKIEYTSNASAKKQTYLVSSVTGDTISGKCSITLAKFYPDWSEIFNQEWI